MGTTAHCQDVAAQKAAVESAMALILEEYQDRHLLVRPHHLPLA
jgi:DNA-binding FrmR family transcriptional regulator